MAMTNLRRLASLKPHDDNLADGALGIWLMFVRLNILSIAFCDAVAWGYLGFITAAGRASYYTAAIAGFIAFTVVGSLDGSFVMHDTTSAQGGTFATTLPRRARFARALAWVRRYIHTHHLAIVSRVLLVVISFTVTAPFLTQFFFSKDIAAALARTNERRVADKRAAITSGYEEKLRDLGAKRAARARDLETEIAGQGKSGRFGPGPTSDAIRSDVAALDASIRNTAAAATAELHAFDTATPEVLASRFSIDFTREGPDTRARVVADMERSPAFRTMRWNINFFIAFLFLGLITLKGFQPASAKRYYSDRLQAAHDDYRLGLFDARLTDRQKPENEGMTPAQFVRWYERNERPLQEADALKDRVRIAREREQAQREGFHGVGQSLSVELTQMNDDLAAANKVREQLDQERTETANRLATLITRIGEQEQELEDFKYDPQMSSGMSLGDSRNYMGLVTQLMERKQACERQLALNRTLRSELENTLARLTQQLADNQVYRDRITAQMDDAGAQARELAELISGARLRNMRDIASTQ